MSATTASDTEPDRLSNANQIAVYIHCGMCIEEWGAGPRTEAPATFARLNAGWTKAGLQIWCQRHDVNVLHIDFEGHRHPANTTKAGS